MTIYLPDGLSQFRAAFDEVCDRILKNKYDEMFYELFVQLVSKMREHPLFKKSLEELEAESFKRQIDFSKTSLNYHEYHWKKLWQYHRCNYQHRRQLVQIKRMITHPREISSAFLHSRLCFAMWQFRCHSPFFRFIREASLLFRKSQLEIKSWEMYAQRPREKNEKEMRIKRAIVTIKLQRESRSIKLSTTPPPEEVQQRKWVVEPFSSLFSPLAQELEYKFGIPGQNNDQKRRNMKIISEKDFRFCWERLMYLERCYNAPSPFLLVKQCLGRWSAIRDITWEAAWERCKNEAFQIAQMSFRQKLSSPPNDSVDTFLASELQIYRRDYEEYLQSFQRHIQAQLFLMDSSKSNEEGVLNLISEGTQKANFVIQLANEYWKAHPQATYDEVFGYYLMKCPRGRTLSRPSWERIVRERKLDPRPPSAKKRGKAKKSLQI